MYFRTIFQVSSINRTNFRQGVFLLLPTPKQTPKETTLIKDNYDVYLFSKSLNIPDKMFSYICDAYFEKVSITILL